MADRWCDHGLYGAYAATPTWGSAQDGDGTAIGAATPATADIVFTGIPSSGTISVLGVTVSPTWATSADNCANLLATAINAATGTAVGPAGITRKSQVRNHVFARGPAGGAPAGTCQIMMRQGTAAVNSQVAITHTLNNVSSGGTINFSGGAGGAWGYVFNHLATVWASAVAISGYGLWAAQLPFCGALDPGDVVKVRSGKTLVLSNTIGHAWTMAAMGSNVAPVVFEVDDGTEWPADGSSPVFKFSKTPANNTSLMRWAHLATSYVYVKGRIYSSGQRSLVMEAGATTATSVPTCTVEIGGPIRFDYLDLVALGTVDSVPGPQSVIFTSLVGGPATPTQDVETVMYRCRQKQPGNPPALATNTLINDTFNSSRALRLVEHTFELTASTGPFTVGIINFLLGSNVHRLTMIAPRFLGFVAGSRLLSPSNAVLSRDSAVVVRDPELGNVGVLGPNFTGGGLLQAHGQNGLFLSSQLGSRPAAVDIPGRMFWEWSASRDRPTLNGRLLDGISPWSIFATTTIDTARINPLSPVELPRIGRVLPPAVDLAEGPRSITVNFLLESTLSWTKADVSVLLNYIDADGTARSIDTWDYAGGALDTSTAAWTATTWNGQTWLKRAITITTPDDVLAGSEIAVYLRLHASVSNETQGVILCPEVLVA